ncbi:TetR/AcrR family transcriptional regulator [Sandarakinorhabdus glacialis]|uniref:TetR/AcrR family transcriptional regulator n=1 Tax=Sandarakinorhabdus glacialis TaxID=1614636 RepID=UPI00166A8829|nr:TetR/AcrR family transcriptional regulator [Polymorphobacter glacialis]
MTAPQTLTDRDNETRRALKRTARRLFSERGVRGITVREIAQAAGQRNQGVVTYYFGTKENLLAEILVDGAERIEARRRVHLARLEADGGPHRVADAVAAIVLPSAEFVDEDADYGSNFNRYLFRLTVYDSAFVDRTLDGRYNEGYRRCLSHLRRLMPGSSRQVQSRRLVFLGSYLGPLLAQREAMLADTADHPTWQSDEMLADIIRTAAAILEA